MKFPAFWGQVLFLMGAAALSAPPGAAEPPGARTASIVTAGTPAPRPLLIDRDGRTELELVAGRGALPAVEALHFSLWAAGGPTLALLVKDQPIEGKLVTDTAGAIRCRFRLPRLDARAGAALRLVISEGEGRRPVADAWLLVGDLFDAAVLRDWAERHPLAVDPKLVEVIAALQEWGVPVQEPGGAAFAIIGEGATSPPGAAVVLMLRRAKDGRVRIVAHPPLAGVTLIEALLPQLGNFATDPQARSDFLSAWQVASALLDPESALPPS